MSLKDEIAELGLSVLEGLPSEDDILVCGIKGTPGMPDLGDNMSGPCRDCGAELMFRPNMAYIKNKLCMDCARADPSYATAEKAVTRATVEEVQALLVSETVKH